MSNKNTLPDKCAVARDLMPLCIDGTASDASQRRVNKHVADCPPCATVYQEMQTNIELDVPDQQETAQFETAVKKVKHKHAWRKLRNVLLGVVLALLVCAAGAYGYYWYFVEDVPLPVELYKVELNLHAPMSERSPVLICTKNMPESAKLHIRIDTDGQLMGDNMQLQPNWVMYIWATATRATDLDSCSYTDYNYYAFDQLCNPHVVKEKYVEGNFVYKGQTYPVNTVYQGAPGAEQVIRFARTVEGNQLKWTTANNMVLRSVASLEITGNVNVAASFVTPEITVPPVNGFRQMTSPTPMPSATLVPATLPLYYNTTDQAIFYHVDPMCDSMDNAYLPLDGQLEYRELKDAFYIGLQPCPHCKAPARNWE